jgi:hypothetical protein
MSPGTEPVALVEVRKLKPTQPGVAVFAASCACGFTTMLHVPVAHVLAPGTTGGYQCDGCGLEHKFAVTVTANGGPQHG